MKRIELEISDLYASVVSTTFIGTDDGKMNVSAVLLDLDLVDKVVIDDNGDKIKYKNGEIVNE